MRQDLPDEQVRAGLSAVRPKPTVVQLGLDLAAQAWQRSGTGDGSFEVAFVSGAVSPARADADWVLLRVAGDPAGRVLLYDRTEWACFLDGVIRGEFDDGAG
jgi:hypothetical protein